MRAHKLRLKARRPDPDRYSKSIVLPGITDSSGTWIAALDAEDVALQAFCVIAVGSKTVIDALDIAVDLAPIMLAWSANSKSDHLAESVEVRWASVEDDFFARSEAATAFT